MGLGSFSRWVSDFDSSAPPAPLGILVISISLVSIPFSLRRALALLG
jgi:hypothetical protein